MKIAVVTTFPNSMWNIYAKQMIESYVRFWPEEIPLLVQLDDDLLFHDIGPILRPQDAIAVGWEEDHAAFVERNKDKDDPLDYRKQAVRFCHKIFAIKRALDAVKRQKKAGGDDTPRYLIWMDADVITTRPVTFDDIAKCLPKEGDAVAYLGRKDWDHSECGWLAFDLENRGDGLIDSLHIQYVMDEIFIHDQWHDSWIFDKSKNQLVGNAGDSLFACKPLSCTNLTENKPGMDIWPHSPMAAWSKHYKGPKAKMDMVKQKTQQPASGSNFVIQTLNAIPNEEIHEHIRRNQALISNWVRPCQPLDDDIVVVSAGPQLVAEDVRKEIGKKIVAVKHALGPLKKAGIKPWASILLDPRPHVLDFVKDADPDVIWFVASQVNPDVTMQLLQRGCTVWGYHVSVNAGEEFLTKQQEHAIVGGGSATATRGLHLLNHLGFSNFSLYGYDLCFPDKPNLNELDEQGQPKYLEISVGMNHPLYNVKRCFWSKPELIAQYEEMAELIKNKKFKLKAYGDGIIPFILKCYEVVDLRIKELRDRITGENPPTCDELIHGTKSNS